jgi:uncharacterized PurR-regulated membrane protein YhhQ (DUF165 family)
MPYLFLYILTIYLVNLGFTHVPLVDLGFGLFSPMAIVVGAIFVIRDYAQRAVGHWVLAGMAIGCLLSYYLADPVVAVASVASFAVSELADWLMYTATKKPFYKRVLYSSIVSAPVDTGLFLFLIDLTSPVTFIMMVVCKLLVAIGIWWYGQNKESATASAQL